MYKSPTASIVTMRPVVVFMFFLVVIVYTVIGVLVFIALEADQETRRQKDILEFFQITLDKYRCLNREKMMLLLDYIDRDLDTARYVLHHNVTYNVMWDWTGAASFVISVITTIGYGHITPRTPQGKVACMVYAMIGIPLLLVFLKGAGELLCAVCSRCLHSSSSQCTARSPVMHRLNAIFQSVLGLAILFTVPCMVNVYQEKWSVLDAVYSSFVTLTTIGFGDFVPGNPADRKSFNTNSATVVVRVLNLLWTLVGLAYISMLITAISNYYVMKTRGVKNQAKRRVEKMKQRLVQKLSCKMSSCHTSTQTDLPPGSSSSPSLSLSQLPSDDVAASSDRHVCLVSFSSVFDHDEASSGSPATTSTTTTTATTTGLQNPQSATVTQSVVVSKTGDDSGGGDDGGGGSGGYGGGGGDCGDGDGDGELIEIETLSSRTASVSVSLHSNGTTPLPEVEGESPPLNCLSSENTQTNISS